MIQPVSYSNHEVHYHNYRIQLICFTPQLVSIIYDKITNNNHPSMVVLDNMCQSQLRYFIKTINNNPSMVGLYNMCKSYIRYKNK